MIRSPGPFFAALLARTPKPAFLPLIALLFVGLSAGNTLSAPSIGPARTHHPVALPPPALTIDDVKHSEGNSGTTPYVFTVMLSSLTGNEVTVNYTTVDAQAKVSNNDYQPTSGTLTIPPNTASGTITVPVNGDNIREGDETFFVNLTDPVNAVIADGQGKGTILNDDGVPSLSINDVSLAEGNSGKTSFTFTVSLSNRIDQPVTVQFATADGSATEANDDYQPTSGTLTIPAKTASGTVTVSVNGDNTQEGNETFAVNLALPVNATIADGQGIGTIQNDDSQPSISINDVGHLEGDGGKTTFEFAVSLSSPTSQTVTVKFATEDGSATVADNDYQPTSGTLTIPAKTVSGTITVSVNGDDVAENDETFVVKLSMSVNATIADNQGVGTIFNDDTFLYISDVEHSEGNSGKTNFVFQLALSHAVSQPVTVDFATADGSATAANNDYQPTSGTVTIPANAVSATITVSVNGDATHEDNETFFVNLSNATNATLGDDEGTGYITNDDAPTGVPELGVTEFALGSVRPNPSRGMTLMEITVPREAAVSLKVLDIQGREVATLVDGVYRPGRYQVTWNAKSARGEVPAGLYFIRYRVPGKELVRRLILAR